MKILSIIWYIASILILYLAFRGTIRYRFINLNIKKIFGSIKSKSKNNIKPLSSLCISLAAKIGVGSLSGIGLAIYYGGIGTIFWLMIVSVFISINTYIETITGMKYREKVDNKYYGGPSYYIRKCLGNKKLSIIYSVLIIISYGLLFLSIQVNTIVTVTTNMNIGSYYVVIILMITIMIIIRKGIKSITRVNSFLVPIMLLFYFGIGIYIIILNYHIIPKILLDMIREAFNIRSIIPIFLLGMQRAIFITESSVGTSAISASSCDNEPDKQAMLEVLGIYITIFIVCFTTFIIIATSNYHEMLLKNVNGIEIVLLSFKYHFGNKGSIILSMITIMFAYSTIISSYFFGENNIINLTKNRNVLIIYKVIFLLLVGISYMINPKVLWYLTDLFLAFLTIINVGSLLKISFRYN
jgi:AGCS family alanine or glycine:cation symporter